MNSGNDAGTAIAEHVSGSVKQFADDLNAFIAEHAGVHDTHFVNPHGLFDKIIIRRPPTWRELPSTQ